MGAQSSPDIIIGLIEVILEFREYFMQITLLST